MITKTFDCVDMKRKGAEKVRSLLKGKTLKEQLDFWKQGTDELRQLKEKMTERKNKE
jgi:hypothetical protein